MLGTKYRGRRHAHTHGDPPDREGTHTALDRDPAADRPPDPEADRVFLDPGQSARTDGKPDEAPRAGTADSRQGAAQSRRNGHSASCGRVEPGRQGPSTFLRRPGVLPAGATSLSTTAPQARARGV